MVIYTNNVYLRKTCLFFSEIFINQMQKPDINITFLKYDFLINIFDVLLFKHILIITQQHILGF